MSVVSLPSINTVVHNSKLLFDYRCANTCNAIAKWFLYYWCVILLMCAAWLYCVNVLYLYTFLLFFLFFISYGFAWNKQTINKQINAIDWLIVSRVVLEGTIWLFSTGSDLILAIIHLLVNISILSCIFFFLLLLLNNSCIADNFCIA